MSIDRNTVHAACSEAVHLPEHLTIQVATDLREQLLALADRQEVWFDGSGVERVDTAGLQVLAAFRKTLSEHGGAIQWAHQSRALSQALELSGISL